MHRAWLRGAVAAALGFLFAAHAALAQATGAQPAEPEEPALDLPTYILEIEDLPAESVEAGLPEEQGLLPPERTPPLPAAGELKVTEPNISLAPPFGDVSAIGSASASFFVEGAVGAGTLHRLVSELSIYRPGVEPRAKLAFTFDMKDGLGGNDAGAGYHIKTDSLEASVDMSPGAVHLAVSGAFTDTDVGLQGQSTFESRIYRTTTGIVDARWQVHPLVALTGGIDLSAAAVLFARGAPEGPDGLTQYELAPTIGVELAVGAFRAALNLAYSLGIGVAADSSVATVHRLEPTLSAAVDLPYALSLAGEVGWHYRLGGSHFVPFSLTFSGAPLDPLWFRLTGGYRVTDISTGDALALPYGSLPATTPQDQKGWFGEGTIRVAVLRNLLLSADADLAFLRDMLTVSAAADTTTGLYAVEQADATVLTATAALRWDITSTMAARLEYTRSFIDRPRFSPSDLVLLDFSGGSRSGRVGGGISGRFDVVPDRGDAAIQVPRVDANAFLRFPPSIKAVVEVEDLLLPLTGTSRVGIPPYVEPGFSVSLRFLVSL